MGQFTARWWAIALTVCTLGFCSATAFADDAEPSGLHEVKAKHYVIHTDIPDAGLVADVGRRMDVMYDQYCKVLSAFKPDAKAPPLPVYLFEARKRYAIFTESTGSGGMFVRTGTREYLASFLDQNGRDEMRRTLQHEAFHQFAYFAVSEHLPTWLNEGIAQLFEEGLWTGRDFILGQIPARRLRQMQTDAKHHKLVTLDKFLKITHADWNKTLETDNARSATYYNEAWALAYFLVHGPDRAYHKRLVDYLNKLHADGKADEQALFADCFPDVGALQKAFERWAAGARATPEATLLERQETLGDFLAALAPRDGSVTRSMSQFRSAVTGFDMSMTYTRGAVKYETEKPATIYFSDLNGRTYGEQQLFFQPARGSPLPDIVCRPNGAFLMRTHFYKGASGVEHESSIEPTG